MADPLVYTIEAPLGLTQGEAEGYIRDEIEWHYKCWFRDHENVHQQVLVKRKPEELEITISVIT
jgi:hypothetical protein